MNIAMSTVSNDWKREKEESLCRDGALLRAALSR